MRCCALPLVLAVVTVFGSAADALAQAKPSQAAQPGPGSFESTLVSLDRRLWEAVRTKDTLAFSGETVPREAADAELCDWSLGAAERSLEARYTRSHAGAAAAHPIA